VGSNRDEFIVLRKMKTVDWLDEPLESKEFGQ
jgi:nitrate reductase alpha subunit